MALILSVPLHKNGLRLFYAANLPESHANRLAGGLENSFGSLHKIFSIAFGAWFVGFHLDLHIFK